MVEMTHAKLLEDALRLRYAFHVSLLASPLHDRDTFNATQERAGDLLELLKQSQMPWQPSREVENERTENYFKEEWRRLMDFDIDDDEAVATWSRKVENTLKDQVTTAEDAARAEASQAAAIRQRADALRTKRQQQWRPPR